MIVIIRIKIFKLVPTNYSLINIISSMFLIEWKPKKIKVVSLTHKVRNVFFILIKIFHSCQVNFISKSVNATSVIPQLFETFRCLQEHFQKKIVKLQALKGMAATFRIASSSIIKTSAERRLSSTDSVLAMLKWVERHFSRRKPRANSLTYKNARKARDTIQMHMSYQLPPRTSPLPSPPRSPDKSSSGSESS